MRRNGVCTKGVWAWYGGRWRRDEREWRKKREKKKEKKIKK